MNYKKHILLTLGTLTVISLIIPVLVLAKNNHSPAKIVVNINTKNKTANTANATSTAGQTICNRLIDFSADVDQKVADRETKLKAKRDEITIKLETKREERDNKLFAKRDQWDTNRQKQFAKLLEHAATDSQKQAVAKFKSDVETAIVARRQTIDTAIQAFRDGVKQTIAQRKTAMDNVINAFNNAIAVAKIKAQTDCTSGVTPKTVRLNYQQALKIARDTFRNDRQNIEKTHSSIELLIAAKKQVIETAIANFKAAMDNARTDLKAAFPTK